MVSNDHSYRDPYKGFATIKEARNWILKFSHWYNFNHKHSGIKYVTLHQRHSGLADKVLANRKEIYQRAKELNPEREVVKVESA